MPRIRPISILLIIAAAGVFAAARTVPQAASHAARHSATAMSLSPHRARAKSPAAKMPGKKDPLAAGRRDPFAPLLSDQTKPGKTVIRPPGKAGLTTDQIEVQGTVRGPRGAVAVVSSPDGHVYFLRPGDRVFDGTVEQIGSGDVVFIQHAHDAFGRAFDRRVTKPVQPPEGAKR